MPLFTKIGNEAVRLLGRSVNQKNFTGIFMQVTSLPPFVGEGWGGGGKSPGSAVG